MSPSRRRLLSVAAIVSLSGAALADWLRPPEDQISVSSYDLLVITPYRAVISPLLSSVTHCRFEPTCSSYSLAAVQRHGCPRGLWFTARRITRCGPWTLDGTTDPVPGAAASPAWSEARAESRL